MKLISCLCLLAFAIVILGAKPLQSSQKTSFVLRKVTRKLKKQLLDQPLLVSQHKPSYSVSNQKSISNVVAIKAAPKKHVVFLSVFLPWLYFISVSMMIPTLPEYINSVINNGNTKVSASSAQVYGNLQGFDSFFTFLSVNLVGCLSDVYGRKIFIFLSSFGLGSAYFLHSLARSPAMFYLGGSIDGLTSCMLSQSQAYITDLLGNQENAGIFLSKFQGLAIGLAFFFGIPFGAVVTKQYSAKYTLRLSACLSAINCVLISVFLPQPTMVAKKVDLRQANPLGAALLLNKSYNLRLSAAAYLSINLAQAGIQATWINYVQARFGWSAAVGGSSLMLVGLMIGILPQLAIPRFGLRTSISLALSLYALAAALLTQAANQVTVIAAILLLAAGASAMPMLLGFMSEQVLSTEIGALQGAADTVRTISSMVGSPLSAAVLAYCIGSERTVQYPAGVLVLVGAFALLSLTIFQFVDKEDSGKRTPQKQL